MSDFNFDFSLGALVRPSIGALTSYTQGAGVAVFYPLDEVAASPQFVYSTRKMRSAYTGPAIRVIRPSDSAEMDIGFLGDALDNAALDAFLGSQTGRVLTRYDQSGNGYHGTQATVGLQAKIDTITVGVHRIISFNGGYYPIPAGVATNKNNLHFFSVHEPLNGRAQVMFAQYGAGVSQISMFQNQSYQIQANGGNAFMDKPQQTRALLMEYASDGTGTYIGNDFETGTSSALASTAMTGGFIGYSDLGYASGHYEAAAVGYAARLSAGDTTTIRAALRSAFSLAATASTKHVIFEGDSIAAASTSADYYGFAKMAQRSIPTSCSTLNIATGGNHVPNILSVYNAITKPVINYYTLGSVIVLLHAGTNDLTVLGRTAAQIYADIQTYAGNVRADGGKVIVSTILPNVGWNATQQTTRTDLNTLIRTNWASFADGLADFAADATMGPQAAASNAALYGDGLHPTRLGHTYLAPIAAAAIGALL